MKIAMGDVVDRTRPGKSPFTMFLQATHDALTEKSPVRMIVALGACQRLPIYTDGWYADEKLKPCDPNTPLPSPARPTTMDDCEQYIDRAEVSRENILQFHPTLLWASIFKGISDLALRCENNGHQLLILHMNTCPDSVWINKSHPLIKPLCDYAENLINYLSEHESCKLLCEEQGIRPLDHDQWSWSGHHGLKGQLFFGEHVRKKVMELNIWN